MIPTLLRYGLVSASVLAVAGCSSETALPRPVGLVASPPRAPDGPALVPLPARLVERDGVFDLGSEVSILTDSESARTAQLLASQIKDGSGISIKVVEGGGLPLGQIVLKVDRALKPALGEEGYRLDVTADRVLIRASGPAGVFYGTRTLLQLLPPESFSNSSTTKPSAWTLPLVSIEDVPRFGWRGAHLDVARHFFSVDFIRRYIDLMALHKLNRFHWHLTNDQGWRLQSLKFPLLTEVGAWRRETAGDRKPYGGFYSQKEVREVVAYAAERFVTVVPEIGMPGHAQAAIAAYPDLGSGTSVEVRTTWGLPTHVMNDRESTFSVLQTLLREVSDLFPGPWIHVGGDEVPSQEWNPNRQTNFARRLQRLLEQKGKVAVGWEEILRGGPVPGALVTVYTSESALVRAVQMGQDVVAAPMSHTYFDYYQSRDVSTEPKAGRFVTTLDRVYSWEPVPSSLSDEEAARIKGVQAQLWTEYVATPEHAEYMAFPRLAAFAEVAWSPRPSRRWRGFASRMIVHAERLSALGVNFRKIREDEY